MPPIRKGDGTPVAPKGISQVRTGDGRILFEGPAIPDSVVDNFEDSSDVDGATEPFGIYDEDETISDKYEGDTGYFERVTDYSATGDYSLHIDDSSERYLAGSTDTGLPSTPSRGDTFEYSIRSNDSNPWRVGLLFGIQDISSYSGQYPDDCYVVGFEETGNDDMSIVKLDGGSISVLTTTSSGVSSDSWHRFEISWENDGDIDVTLYDGSGNSLASMSANDDDFDGGGVGFTNPGSGSREYWFDGVEIID